MTATIKDFYDFDRGSLAELFQNEFGEKPFRATQMFQWVYQKQVTHPEEMTNISHPLRLKIAETFSIPSFCYSQKQISKDGSAKYLIPVDNDQEVESVFIAQERRNTLCVSSQVGCALGCTFCRTGTMGLTRHLRTSEIVRQFLTAQADAKENDDSFSNMVFMGMGEPLHNIDNVLRAISIITDDYGIGFSGRRITVSTVGLAPAIKKFFASGTTANLAVSLNATNDEVRSAIMPINKRFPLEVLLGTLRELDLPKRKRVTIEYVMLAGVNDTDADLKRLPQLLRGIPAKVNLIPYNANAALGFETPAKEKVITWQRKLLTSGLVTTIRWSKGQDIDAACGQLRTESLRRKAVPQGASLSKSPSLALV